MVEVYAILWPSTDYRAARSYPRQPLLGESLSICYWIWQPCYSASKYYINRSDLQASNPDFNIITEINNARWLKGNFGRNVAPLASFALAELGQPELHAAVADRGELEARLFREGGDLYLHYTNPPSMLLLCTARTVHLR